MKKIRICISFICAIMLFPLAVNARYFEKIESITGKAKIAEPIFKVENSQDTIIETINKQTPVKEYIFNVKNYVLESDGITKRISQVDMSYYIEIINEKPNFPVKYELYELDLNENILNENSRTEDILVSKDIEYQKTYKLVIYWDSKDGILENTDNIKIIVNSSQVK